MFFIILAAIIFIIGIVLAVCKRNGFIVLMAVIIAYGSMIPYLFIQIAVQSLSVRYDTIEYEVIESKDLCALKDTMGMEVKRYLLTSSGESKMQYNYIVETSTGYAQKKVYAEDCFIKCTEDQPKIITIEVVPESKVARFFVFPWEMYIFEVPEDSLPQDIEIDLE